MKLKKMLNKKIFVIVGILIVIGLTFNITPIKGAKLHAVLMVLQLTDKYIFEFLIIN